MIIVVSVCLNRFGCSAKLKESSRFCSRPDVGSTKFCTFPLWVRFCWWVLFVFDAHFIECISSALHSIQRCLSLLPSALLLPPPLTPPRLHFRDEFIAETMFVSQPSNRTLIKSTKRQGRKKGSKSNVSHSFNPQRRHQFNGNINQPSNQRPTKSKAIK